MKDPCCPECGGALTLDPDAETETTVFVPNPGGMPYLDVQRRRAVVAFCSACEFAVEIR